MCFGGEIKIGRILDVLLDSLVTGWAVYDFQGDQAYRSSWRQGV